ncbi:MAG: hypothetical protein JWL90_2445 [Chthoniobacteraceae bacterium]|nr:hypothetical protein [Chthoniobacteraceae bacterium]MDB6174145.1 hypothetical protein [Chthoniobacteraceae bacterium]
MIMNPKDPPTILHIPALCAADGVKEFTDLFIDEICDHHYLLPLDRFCTNGGEVDDVEDNAVEVKKFNKTTVVGTYSFTFYDSSTEGCKDRDWTENRSASIEFVFHRSTGKLELSGNTLKRIDEPNQF